MGGHASQEEHVCPGFLNTHQETTSLSILHKVLPCNRRRQSNRKLVQLSVKVVNVGPACSLGL